MIKANHAHKLSDDSQRNFYSTNLRKINEIITRQAKLGGYKVKYPISFKISFYPYDEENATSIKQEQDRKKDVLDIVKVLEDSGYTVSYRESSGSKELPIYCDNMSGDEAVYDYIKEVSYLYELIISW